MIDFQEYRLGTPRDGVRLSDHNPRCSLIEFSYRTG